MTARPLAAATDAELLDHVAAMFDAADPMPAGVVTSCRDLTALAVALVVADMPPSGCSWCGLAQRDHYSRYVAVVGWHRYTVPSQEQIKARMLARRRHALTRRAVS
jgi:hypothetical protein